MSTLADTSGLARRRWGTAATLIGCATVAAVHLWLLSRSGLDPASAPISALSRIDGGVWHGVALGLFAIAHIALAALLYRPGGGRMHRTAIVLLAMASVLVVRVALHFASADEATLDGAGANAPLWYLASLIGVAMGLLAPGLFRTHPGAARWNLVCLIVWIALMPLILLIDGDLLGAYERLTGTVYALWMVGLALLVGLSRGAYTGRDEGTT